MPYSIVRFYRDINKENEVLETGLTLEEAKEHCADPASREAGEWFDGFREE